MSLIQTFQALIRSYEFDIADLERDIAVNGSTPAAERTLKRLKAKLRKLRS